MSDKAKIADNQQETTFVSSNLINHKWGLLRDYAPNTLNYTDELVTLIALLYTDGGVSRHHLSSWRVFFANTSVEAINLFREVLVKTFKISPDRIKVRITANRYYFAVLTSKTIGDFLIKTFGNFRTLRYSNGKFPDTSIPVDDLISYQKAELFFGSR